MAREVVQVRREIRIEVVPRSLLGRLAAVALAIVIVALMSLFLAAGVALLGLVLAIAIGRVLWVSMKRPRP